MPQLEKEKLLDITLETEDRMFVSVGKFKIYRPDGAYEIPNLNAIYVPECDINFKVSAGDSAETFFSLAFNPSRVEPKFMEGYNTLWICCDYFIEPVQRKTLKSAGGRLALLNLFIRSNFFKLATTTIFEELKLNYVGIFPEISILLETHRSNNTWKIKEIYYTSGYDIVFEKIKLKLLNLKKIERVNAMRIIYNVIKNSNYSLEFTEVYEAFERWKILMKHSFKLFMKKFEEKVRIE